MEANSILVGWGVAFVSLVFTEWYKRIRESALLKQAIVLEVSAILNRMDEYEKEILEAADPDSPRIIGVMLPENRSQMAIYNANVAKISLLSKAKIVIHFYQAFESYVQTLEYAKAAFSKPTDPSEGRVATMAPKVQKMMAFHSSTERRKLVRELGGELLKTLG